MSHQYASESVNLVNDHVTDISENVRGYHCRTSLETIGENLYKFRNDSVRPRRFLSTDDKNGINTIFSDHEEHSLHKIIDGDEPLHLIIDFNLPKETLVAIEPKLTSNGVANILVQRFSETCKEVFSK